MKMIVQYALSEQAPTVILYNHFRMAKLLHTHCYNDKIYLPFYDNIDILKVNSFGDQSSESGYPRLWTPLRGLKQTVDFLIQNKENTSHDDSLFQGGC